MKVALRYLFRYEDCDCGFPDAHSTDASKCLTECGCQNPECEKRNYKIFDADDQCHIRLVRFPSSGGHAAALVCKVRNRNHRFASTVYVLEYHLFCDRYCDSIVNFLLGVAQPRFKAERVGEIPAGYTFDPVILRRYPLRKNRGKQNKN